MDTTVDNFIKRREWDGYGWNGTAEEGYLGKVEFKDEDGEVKISFKDREWGPQSLDFKGISSRNGQKN